jgi:pimeloyl-ACP methyl ester carboxylesterase
MQVERKAFELQMEPDRVIRGDIYQAASQPSRGALILCHGYKGFKDWGMFPHVARALADEIDVVAINFSHNGVGADLLTFTELEKFAGATYTKDLEDLDAVVRFVRSGLGSEADPAKPILLLGHSRGAGVCLINALDHPERISGVISWNGITDVDLLTEANKAEMRAAGRSYTLNGRTKQMMPLDLVILEDMEQNRERFDIVNRIKDAAFPIALIQGTRDGSKLIAGSARLVERNPRTRWIRVADGDHTFGAVHPFRVETMPLKDAIAETKKVIREMLYGG